MLSRSNGPLRRNPRPARAQWADIPFTLALLLFAAGVTPGAQPVAAASPAIAAAPSLATLPIPGDPAFVRVARDVAEIRFAIDPSIPAGAGLFEDAVRVPSFDPANVAKLLARLDADQSALRAMPWRNWEVDRQIDWRWVYALADDARLQLAQERLFQHRPSSWLEPLANTYIALFTYAPERADLRARLTGAIPAMVEEMRHVVTEPTARDLTTADGVADGIVKMLEAEPPAPERDAAIKALSAYVTQIREASGLPEYRVIGAANFAARLRRALLLPWTPQQLLARAQRELSDVDAAMAILLPQVEPAPVATPEQIALARDLDQEKLLAIYDEIERSNRAFLDSSDLLTIPPEVGPIRARPTPEAMIPLSGDGGSMNPPPPFIDTNIGWWNVEHFRPDWTPEKREERVVSSQEHRRTGMGTYSVHEGVPGHHLQLSIARLNPNPLRSLFGDNALIEGWSMYAEEIFWQAGGLGDSPGAEYRKLRSWRGRIRRVFYDVNVECGDWTLQDGADFRHQALRGRGKIDEDVLRAINWPAQLVCYFSGKVQIQELKEAYRVKLGPAFTERKFNDALLAEGSIPVALIRAKLLGEPVPAPVPEP